MHARFFLLLAMLLGVALAPVSPALGACVLTPPAACGGCCAERAAATQQDCCKAAETPLPAAPLAPGNPSFDGKILAAPVLMVIELSPVPAVEFPAVCRASAVGLPAQPLLARHCIWLI